MLTLKIGIEGKTTGDLEQALQECLRLVSGGNLSGFDSNDTERYSFSVTGEEGETKDEDEEDGEDNEENWEDEDHEAFDAAFEDGPHTVD